MPRDILSALDLLHADLVRRLAKDPQEINLRDADKDLMHAAFGIFGEAGELCDAIKKAIIYNKPLDMDNMVEELGDLEFYLQQLRARLNISRRQCLEANIAKLNKRYPQGTYSDADAQARADKQVEDARRQPLASSDPEAHQQALTDEAAEQAEMIEATSLREQIDALESLTCRDDDDMNQPGDTLLEVVTGIMDERNRLREENTQLKSTQSPEDGPTKSVLLRIAQERQRQREKWGDEHDDTHYGSELASAAAFWASPKGTRDCLVRSLVDDVSVSIGGILWPFIDQTCDEALASSKDKGETREDELVRAAAFIVSEIEHLRRKEAASG